jgi:ABC-type multidrug transport system permease subunit
MNHSALYQLTLARLREFLREPEAVFWVFAFPILLALALAIAFRDQPPQPVPVGVEEGPRAEARRSALEAGGEIAPRIVSRQQGERELRRGKLALVVLATEPPTYWSDPTRPDSRLAALEVDRALQGAAGRADRFAAAREEMKEPGSRYIDFLVPGLLGMNLMGTGMWSIGFALVQYRAGRLLKRFIAAPVARWKLLAAPLLARFVFLGMEVTALLLFAVFALDVPVRGSLFTVGLVCILGALAFVGIGLLLAARPRTIEGVSGLMNLVMMPMWIGSGTFFSRERFPDAAQPFLQALPLTALNDALRDVLLDGAGFAAVLPEMGVLAFWGVATFAVALRIFRWE